MGKRFKHDWRGTVLIRGLRYLGTDIPAPPAEFIKEKKTQKKLGWYVGLWTRIAIRLEIFWMKIRMFLRGGD